MDKVTKYIILVVFITAAVLYLRLLGFWNEVSFGPYVISITALLVFVSFVTGIVLGIRNTTGTSADLSEQKLPPFMSVGDRYSVVGSYNAGFTDCHLVRRVVEAGEDKGPSHIFYVRTKAGMKLPKVFDVWDETVVKGHDDVYQKFVFREFPNS